MHQTPNILHHTNRNTQPALPSIAYGKIPPQARQLEELVLGAIMLSPGAIDTAIQILKPECFYTDAHQRIYKAFTQMYQRGIKIDIPLTVEQLVWGDELDAVGGPYAVAKLTNNVTSTANFEAHCRVVLQKFIQRELIRISGEILGEAYNDGADVFTLLDDAETKMFGISNAHLKKNYEHIIVPATQVINRIDKLQNTVEELSGVPTGFAGLDNITNGWQPSDLIILAARPSIGKTALALNLAMYAATHHTKPTAVGFFSLEMSAQQLAARVLSAQSEVPLQHITRGRMDKSMYKQLQDDGLAKLNNMNIYIDDTAALNIFELRAKARRMVHTHKVGLILVDYLQLMNGSTNKTFNREQEISNISRSLKALAKELSVPIIALSQLSRAIETRSTGKVPQLSDLRESGAIEQDADMVMFIYHPEEHPQNKTPETSTGSSTQSNEPRIKIAEIRVAKNRNGPLGALQLKANLSIQKFEEHYDGQLLLSAPGKPAYEKPFIGNKDSAYRD